VEVRQSYLYIVDGCLSTYGIAIGQLELLGASFSLDRGLHLVSCVPSGVES
jgi:hypothetical protein